jgi:indolepyruvate ferredoxin oxidoreductase alpha subunit
MGEDTIALDPVDILKAVGYKTVAVVDPCDLKAMNEVVDEAMKATDSFAIVTKRPCVLIKTLPPFKTKCKVETEKCKKCKMCLKVGCPAISFKNGTSYIEQSMCVGCDVCLQVCKFDAIVKVGEQ